MASASTQAAKQSLQPADWVRRMPRPAVASSEGLGWESLSAYRFRNPKRFELSLPPVDAHFVVAHLRNPTQMNARWNGRWVRTRTVPGRIMIVPAHHETYWEWDGEIEELQIFLRPALLEQAACELNQRNVSLVSGIAIEDRQIWSIAMDLQCELDAAGVGTRLFADTSAQRLALALLRGHSTLSPGTRTASTSIAPIRLKRALDFIEAGLCEDLPLGSIAAAAGVSEFHFARAFKRATGRTPHRYLTERRLVRAQHLLRTTDLRLADIAQASGFGSQSHFTCAFRAFTGTTPKRYRATAAG